MNKTKLQPLCEDLSKFKFVQSESKIDKENHIFPGADKVYEMFLKKWNEEVNLKLREHFKKLEPNIPDKVIQAFINMFISFKIDNEYDIKTQYYTLTITPFWRDVDMIDYDSENAKILDEYLFKNPSIEDL